MKSLDMTEIPQPLHKKKKTKPKHKDFLQCKQRWLCKCDEFIEEAEAKAFKEDCESMELYATPLEIIKYAANKLAASLLAEFAINLQEYYFCGKDSEG